MSQQRNAIQTISLIMSKPSLDVNATLDLIEMLNTSVLGCRDIVTILEDIFKHQKSNKIIVAVGVLEYLVKNCNRNFHNTANRQSFQKSLLGLLKRLRGKTNVLKQLSSNIDNWIQIQAKVLYLVQLWYDAFILEQSKYPNIINTYKVLRKQGITFPPRSKNQKSLIFVHTQSPIFDNIQQIAYEDQKKFKKKLQHMNLRHLEDKLEDNIKKVEKKSMVRKVDVDKIGQKIAILRSIQYEGPDVLKIIQQIKKDIEYGQVQQHQKQYWKQIKQVAQKLIIEWQQKNSQLVKNQEQLYLQKKLGLVGQNKKQRITQIQASKSQIIKPVNLIEDFDFNNEIIEHYQKPKQQKREVFDMFEQLIKNQPKEQSKTNPQNKEIDLLDL